MTVPLTPVPGKFTKIPVTIEAMQFDGTDKGGSALMRWANQGEISAHQVDPVAKRDEWYLTVRTIEGEVLYVNATWWVIKGVEGEFYPCKDSVFCSTYSAADGKV